MNIIKIENNHYSFGEFTILSSYSKESKEFTFNIIQNGFIPEKVVTKSFVEFKNKVASVVASIVKPEPEVEKVESSIDIDWDLTEEELAIANFIRSYNPEFDLASPVAKEEMVASDLSLSISKVLESSLDGDYANFRYELELALN
jgi:hypothetical protein